MNDAPSNKSREARLTIIAIIIGCMTRRWSALFAGVLVLTGLEMLLFSARPIRVPISPAIVLYTFIVFAVAASLGRGGAIWRERWLEKRKSRQGDPAAL